MTLTADSHGRITSLELFPPGTSFEPQMDTHGRIILKRLISEEPKRVYAKLVRRGEYLVFESPFEVTPEAIAKAVADERASM